jgi:CRISPR-associated endoribonuclease Cas6
LVDPELAEKIHSNKIKRAFLFSNFIFDKKRRRSFFVYFTTSNPDIVNSLLKSFSKNTILSNDSKSLIFDFRGLNISYFDLGVVDEFNFLSPIVIREKNGKSKIKNPLKDYPLLIEEEIKRSINSIASKILNQKLDSFDVKVQGEFRKKRYCFTNQKQEFVTVYALEALTPYSKVTFQGDPKAKSIALLFGVGDKTKLGFGMLGCIKKVI